MCICICVIYVYVQVKTLWLRIACSGSGERRSVAFRTDPQGTFAADSEVSLETAGSSALQELPTRL